MVRDFGEASVPGGWPDAVDHLRRTERGRESLAALISGESTEVNGTGLACASLHGCTLGGYPWGDGSATSRPLGGRPCSCRRLPDIRCNRAAGCDIEKVDGAVRADLRGTSRGPACVRPTESAGVDRGRRCFGDVPRLLAQARADTG